MVIGVQTKGGREGDWRRVPRSLQEDERYESVIDEVVAVCIGIYARKSSKYIHHTVFVALDERVFQDDVRQMRTNIPSPLTIVVD